MLLRRLVIFGAVGLALAAASGTQARTVYDGSWGVEVTGKTEGCMGTARYTLDIRNGKISYGGSDASVTGRVTGKGIVTVRIATSGGQAGVGSGRLTRNYGSGTFKGRSSSGLCAGTWTGQRLG